MNAENLHELIRRYEDAIGWIYGTEHDELFKWRAVATWRREWLKPEDAFSSFGERFTAAKKDFSLFMDNSRMHPSSGVIKLWEKEPATVEHLFSDILFAETKGDIAVVQDHMDTFLDDYEGLRQKYYPGNWSYKQDRHSASVFLAMHDPALNYVFKSSEASTMAKYIDFGLDIGAGSYFKLPNYYQLCEVIICALKEHESLLEKHFNMLDDRCYRDHSLHLLAFDLMYCSRTYSFYHDLPVPVRQRSTKKASAADRTAIENAQKEEERRAKIEAIEKELNELENISDGCEDISLIGVQVSSTQYGIGIVVSQEVNKIDVQFQELSKTFILSKKYPSRPRFEDDETIVEAFTEYGERMDRINSLKRQLDKLTG